MRKTTHAIARSGLLLAALAALLGIAALAWAGWRWADDRAAAATDRAARAAAAGHANWLASELQKFRLLPLVLAEYPDVAAALRDPAVAGRLNRDVELLAARTGAAAIYAMDATGRTVAASNWRLPTSFVGQRYGFRPYFVDAMRHGSAELFALGTVSGRPGLYLARRIERGGRALGAIVVKVEFDRLEAAWRQTPGFTLAVDAEDIVLATSRPGWRFTALSPPSPQRVAASRRTLQFGQRPPAPAPLRLSGRTAMLGEGGDEALYRVARVASPLAGGAVLHFSPFAPARAAARNQALLIGLTAAFALAMLGAVLLRGFERRRLQAAGRAELEQTVVARTAELRDSNRRLADESAERLAADLRYRAAREELAQASRLGSLGQITAGVAHELNQPVAAIRAYAENGLAFLARAAPEQARANLERIVGLTDRVGVITGELRAFARRQPSGDDVASFGRVLDGALLLTPERVRARLRLTVADAMRWARVRGDRIRLEQVLVNLIANAGDATASSPTARIDVTVEATAAGIAVAVGDDGAGVPAALRDTLFEPFVTGRADGLGLGLPIAREIARDYGGDLVLDRAAGPTRFVLTLRRA